jgi:hypothetical protein
MIPLELRADEFARVVAEFLDRPGRPDHRAQQADHRF